MYVWVISVMLDNGLPIPKGNGMIVKFFTRVVEIKNVQYFVSKLKKNNFLSKSQNSI